MENTVFGLAFKISEEKIYIPDYSGIVQGILTKMIDEGKVSGRVLIHKGLVTVFEQLSAQGKAIGMTGLEEIRRLRLLHEKGLIALELIGEKPRTGLKEEEVISEINYSIREHARSLGAILVTGDPIQYRIAQAYGLQVLYVAPKEKTRLEFEKFFDQETMSVHLKEGVEPLAKKGRPGEWAYSVLSSKPLSKDDIERMANEIIEESRRRSDAFIEIDRVGSTIIQLGEYRIVITRPPLSDGWEITAVKPVRKLKLEEYNLPEELVRRLGERAEGILIAGAPGMGKTTFAQALAEYYMRQGKVVKTIESPRDMILPPNITQYSKNYADLGELHDILLLSRPDYTVFDEMRYDEDFKLFADLRLAGIGMIGVVHATSPIDAVQRFIGRVELGMIPSIIDTVIFIRNGVVDKVYDVKMTVKLPTGLKEAELSRPVIEVRDFLTGELEYEIYTFGEQTVVVPVKKLRGKPSLVDSIIENVKKILPDAEVSFEDNVIVVAISRSMLKNYNRRVKRLRKLEEKYNIPVKIKIV
ncbi:PINc/VapC family ATPase [Thermosphaera aggregans]|uniref:ATPase, PilT family n=1 Tax=Thermosphaera aggregans (strain DSM 11486 / M11TL) TaxID=633148 RepID=D5U103_THEAM|nr:ATPase, PilT family [Thermosphaera aggregans DSM 11486]